MKLKFNFSTHNVVTKEIITYYKMLFFAVSMLLRTVTVVMTLDPLKFLTFSKLM